MQEPSHIYFNQFRVKTIDLPYLAPELLKDAKLGPASDSWTIGMILLICMNLAYDPEQFKEQKAKHLALL